MMRAPAENAGSYFLGRNDDDQVVVVILGPIDACLTVQAARDLHASLDRTLTARDVLAAHTPGAPA